MMAFTADGQLDRSLVEARDRDMRTSTGADGGGRGGAWHRVQQPQP